MHAETKTYNASQTPADQKICALLAREIDRHLPEAENKIWHAHPVWFLDGNPFWSGQWDYKNIVRRKGTLVRLS